MLRLDCSLPFYVIIIDIPKMFLSLLAINLLTRGNVDKYGQANHLDRRSVGVPVDSSFEEPRKLPLLLPYTTLGVHLARIQKSTSYLSLNPDGFRAATLKWLYVRFDDSKCSIIIIILTIIWTTWQVSASKALSPWLSPKCELALSRV